MAEVVRFQNSRAASQTRHNNICFMAAVLADEIAAEIKRRYPNLDVTPLDQMSLTHSIRLREYLNATLIDLGCPPPADFDSNEDDGA